MTAHLALIGFIAFMVGSPGPAHLMAMLAGVTQGLRGCVGFISGMAVGKVCLNLFIGFGFGVVLFGVTGLGLIFLFLGPFGLRLLAAAREK